MVKPKVPIDEQMKVYQEFRDQLFRENGTVKPYSDSIYDVLQKKLPAMTKKAIQTSIIRNSKKLFDEATTSSAQADHEPPTDEIENSAENDESDEEGVTYYELVERYTYREPKIGQHIGNDGLYLMERYVQTVQPSTIKRDSKANLIKIPLNEPVTPGDSVKSAILKNAMKNSDATKMSDEVLHDIDIPPGQSESHSDYQVHQVDLEENSVDPFDRKLRNALLDKVYMRSYFQQRDTCQLVDKVPPLEGTIQFKDMQFDMVDIIGQGAYGQVFNVKSRKDGKMYAVKSETPANYWEYYICTEVHCRIASKISHGYMNVNYGIMGDNGSILFSEYSPYGTLLDVCNRTRMLPNRCVNESIVFILAYQMLDIIDHLHSSGILHLDLKPDNILVMKKMSSGYRDLFIKLIDFGNSVDLKQFTYGKKFNASVETQNFTCIEMMERRPWIHQPDLFCLAGTVHSALFGHYMEVEKKSSGDYEIQSKSKLKLYFNEQVWEKFFQKLINIKDSESKPVLQEMKEMFVTAIDNDKNLILKIRDFNKFIESK